MIDLMSEDELRRECVRQAQIANGAMAEAERYREALVRISDAESGRWGWIAYDALHPDRPPHDAHGGSDGG